MRIIDISRKIEERMAIYGNQEEKRPEIIQTRKFEKDRLNESRISLDSHTGTHIDAPYHISENGKKIDEISLDKFYGKCKVFDLTKVEEKITKYDLEKLYIQEGDIILFKTKNSFNSENKEFNFNFIFLNKIGAQYLVEKKIKTVGIDELGIERKQPNHETHKFLLEAGISIIEGLDLSNVKEGEYIICCFPLKIWTDAAPVRAVLIK